MDFFTVRIDVPPLPNFFSITRTRSKVLNTGGFSLCIRLNPPVFKTSLRVLVMEKKFGKGGTLILTVKKSTFGSP